MASEVKRRPCREAAASASSRSHGEATRVRPWYPARKTAFTPGASAGLGAESARLFAKAGHDVILVARRRAKLDELATELAGAHGIGATAIAIDLPDPAAPSKLF